MEKDSQYKELATAVNKLLTAINNNTASLWTPMVNETVECIVLGEKEYQRDEDDEEDVAKYTGIETELQAVEELIKDFQFQELKDGMDFNGYAWKNDKTFLTDSDKPCYVPQHAEDIDDVFNKATLMSICEIFVNSNNLKISAEKLLVELYYSVDWQHPDTWLKDYLELLED